MFCYPVAPYSALESAPGRRPMVPRPPLAGVLIGVDDARCELLVTVDLVGLMTVSVFAHDVEASGSDTALVDYPNDRTSVAMATVPITGYDPVAERCVVGTASISLCWTIPEQDQATPVIDLVGPLGPVGVVGPLGAVEVEGMAIVRGLNDGPVMRFGAVRLHPCNLATNRQPTSTPFAVHSLPKLTPA